MITYKQTNNTDKLPTGMKASKKGKSGVGGEGGCGCPHLPSLDDLRYYAYEGDGSSPGSLSSCCSGEAAHACMCVCVCENT